MKPIQTLMSTCVAVVAISLSACQKEGPAERAGKAIDESVEKAGEKIESATEKAGDAVERTGDKVKKKLED